MGNSRYGKSWRPRPKCQWRLDMSVNLEWVALACFRIWENDGPVIVTDPYEPWSLELTKEEDINIRLEGDIVTCSSLTDVAHSNYKLVDGNPEVINALDVSRSDESPLIYNEPLIAVEARESDRHPDGPDANALYSFKVGGLWFLHMGDVGFGLSNDRISLFKNRCDILLALTGEALTLPLHELDPMIEYLDPTWIVPMHYNLAPVSGSGPGEMTKVEKFIERRSNDPVIYAGTNTVSFPMTESQTSRPTIVILEPSGYVPTTK